MTILGVSTYDAIALILSEKKIAPFKYCRIGTDLICTITGFVLGNYNLYENSDIGQIGVDKESLTVLFNSSRVRLNFDDEKYQ